MMTQNNASNWMYNTYSAKEAFHMTTPEEASAIAGWMLEEYLKQERLVQHSAARHIRTQFGDKHVYKNQNGNWAINKPILDTFKAIRPVDVVWSRGDQLWRKRRPYDKAPGTMAN